MTDTILRLAHTIKTLIEKGDKAVEKAEQFYIAAGQHLKAIKAEHDDRGGTWGEWEALLKSKIGIGKSRASELMQIADRRKTVAQVVDDRRKRQRKAKAITKAKLSVGDGENAGDPEASAQVMKAKHAALDDAGDQTKEPPRAEVAKLVRAWVSAAAKVKRQFVRERWDEIARVRKQVDANGADHEDRWIEGETP
jgi:hypothetical protein